MQLAADLIKKGLRPVSNSLAKPAPLQLAADLIKKGLRPDGMWYNTSATRVSRRPDHKGIETSRRIRIMDNPDINILQIIKTLEGEKQLLELKLAHYERMIELMRRMLLSEPQATEESEADDDGPVKKEVPCGAGAWKAALPEPEKLAADLI